MLLGLASGTAYLVWVRSGGAGFWGVTQLTFGIVGSLVSLVSMVVVSLMTCLLYTSPSPRDKRQSRMPSSA